MRLLGVMLVCVGCHGPGSVAPDSATEPDGPVHALGMSVAWSANPAVPGEVTSKLVVTDVSFQLEHFQLVSDAGADVRTTHSRYQLHWAAGAMPARDAFPDAPVSTYQKLSLDMRPGSQLPYSYQILGTWRDESGLGSGSGGEDEVMPFRIVNPMALSFPIDCNVSLPPGGSASIGIKLQLQKALDHVDFKNVPVDGGVRVLAGGPMLMDLNDRLAKAFEVELEQDD
ncbi:MAG TPA: hypothetical protein VGD37_26025 [Kofleriaceae bacterium]|jgi:hypothetical protein